MSTPRGTSPSDPDTVEVTVDSIAHGGIGVARLDGRVVFVADAIPGERVRARVAEQKSSYWRADTVEVLDASPDRVEHVWGAASIDRDPAVRAGGAEFGHIAPARQRALKTEVLRDALKRMAGIEHPVEVEAVAIEAPDAAGGAAGGERVTASDAAGDGRRWRTRMRLHLGPDGRIGPFAARSHTVVAVDDLPLATAAIEEAAGLGIGRGGGERLFAEYSGGSAGRPAALEFVETASGEVRVVPVAEERSKTAARRGRGGPGGGRDRRGGKGRAGSAASGAAADSAAGAARTAKPATIIERVGEREFRLAENGFWQVHPAAAGTLSAAVRTLVRPELFDPRAANLDLYGGVGLLAAALGDEFGQALRVTSVESDAVATEYAAENLAEWVGARAETARVDRYLAGLEREGAGGGGAARRSTAPVLAGATVVLDPPRSGAGKAVVASLGRLAPAQIVYVACDPVALARDTALFAAAGYELAELRAFDLFPHTHHLESVALMLPTG